MDLKLRSHRVLLLGASRGIGRMIAAEFVAEGASVAIGARNEYDLQEAVRQLSANTDAIVWGQKVDAVRHDELEQWVDAAAMALGGIDAVVAIASGHCAGTKPGDWSLNLATDVLGSATLLDAALPFLLEAAERRGDASCIFIASAAAALSFEPSAYGPLKAALIHLAAGYARRLATDRIRVNVISPGMIYFPGGGLHTTEKDDPLRLQFLRNMIPAQRFGSLDEVAKSVVFLTSPVSSYTTGANLRIDGGMTSHVDY